VKLAGVATPLTVAVTAYVPDTLFAVADTVARPLASVVAVVALNVDEAPDVADANVTVTPGTALPDESFTTATSNAPNDVDTDVDCHPPPPAVPAAPTRRASDLVKLAGVPTPLTVAVTAYDPATPFAVDVTLARPLASVVAVVALSTALALLPGTAKVTV